MSNPESDKRQRRRMPLLYAVIGACVLITALSINAQAGNLLQLNFGNDTKIYFNDTESQINGTFLVNGSPVCTLASGCGSGSGTVTSVNASSQSSAVVNITPSAITTSGTLLFQFPDATTLQSGFMTATQATTLALKALGGSCSGWNSTHINVTMNATTSGVQCVAVQYNQSATVFDGNITNINATTNVSLGGNLNIRYNTTLAGCIYHNGTHLVMDGAC